MPSLEKEKKKKKSNTDCKVGMRGMLNVHVHVQVSRFSPQTFPSLSKPFQNKLHIEIGISMDIKKHAFTHTPTQKEPRSTAESQKPFLHTSRCHRSSRPKSLSEREQQCPLAVCSGVVPVVTHAEYSCWSALLSLSLKCPWEGGVCVCVHAPLFVSIRLISMLRQERANDKYTISKWEEAEESRPPGLTSFCR